jgi:arsenate reductase (glutaredoxin)
VITVYEKRTCTTCRKLDALLRERGIETTRVDYHVEGLPEAKLRELVRKAGVAPRDLLRLREPQVAALGLEDPAMDDDTRLRLMAEHPETVQRPIVETADRAVLARPVERVLELLGG